MSALISSMLRVSSAVGFRLVALLAVIGTVGLAKRVLDRNTNSVLNNLFVGAVGLAGFVILLQGVRALF